MMLGVDALPDFWARHTKGEASDGGAWVRDNTLLAGLGLEGRSGVRAASLSGGERRRLELARALAGAPRVLLCDEPFAAIDPLGAGRAASRLRALAGAGAAVLIADHHVDEALRLCDRAALLLEGEIAAVAAPPEFLSHPLVRKHYSEGVPPLPSGRARH